MLLILYKQRQHKGHIQCKVCAQKVHEPSDGPLLYCVCCKSPQEPSYVDKRSVAPRAKDLFRRTRFCVLLNVQMYM